MKQFTITRQARTWLPVEFAIENCLTGQAIFGALYSQSWKSRYDVYRLEGDTNHLLFSIKARDVFSWTYEVVDAENKAIGCLDRENFLSPLWQITDNSNGTTAQITRVSPSLDEEFRLDLNKRTICWFRKGSGFSHSAIRFNCSDEAEVDLNLMLSVGLLLLGPGFSVGDEGVAG